MSQIDGAVYLAVCALGLTLGTLTWLLPITWAGGQPGCDICQSDDGQDSLATLTLFGCPNVPSKDYLAVSCD